MTRIHLHGPFRPGQIASRWSPAPRPPVPPAIQNVIDQSWQEANARPGVHLFDGPMCRLDGWKQTPGRLTLDFSITSYKPFVGTNLSHPELADQFGPDILANALGVSAIILAGDGRLILGRRGPSVIHYPDRLHTFGGCIAPVAHVDVFNEVRRELDEELNLSAQDVSDLYCTGLVEDQSLRQPELVFAALCRLDSAQIIARLDGAEHSAAWSTPATAPAAAEMIANPELTPVARSAVALWGRIEFGQDWFGSLPRQ
jgi:hypothetical protein